MDTVDVRCLPASEHLLWEIDEIARCLPYAVHQRAAWYRNYIEAFQIEKQVQILRVAHPRGEPIGFLPLQIEKSQGRLRKLRQFVPLAKGPSDFVNLLVHPSCETQFAQAVVYWLKQHSRSWEHLYLPYIPALSPAWKPLAETLEAGRFEVSIDPCRYSLEVDTTGSWDEYYHSFYKKHNEAFIRKIRQLKRCNMYPELITIRHNIQEYLPKLLPFYDQRRNALHQKNPYKQTLARRQFFEHILDDYEAMAAVELNLLMDRDQCVWAYVLDWLHQGTRFHYMTAFNEEFKQYSPGKLIFYEILKQSFADPKISRCNWCRGEDDYKSHMGNVHQPYVCLTITNPRSFRLRRLLFS
jgi:CelD/BcsL family acetyltransferase involved in cellulose biosynthesis